MKHRIKKFTISKIAWLTHHAHKPEDEDSDDMGSVVFLKKGNKLEIADEILLKGLYEEIDLPEQEFDIEEIEKSKVDMLYKPGFDEKENTIRFQVIDSKQFDRFFVDTPKETQGIQFLMGVKGKEGSKLQSIIFSKSAFTMAEAKTWIKDNLKSLQKGENIEAMELKEISELFDEKLAPITIKLEEHAVLLAKFAKPPEDPPPEKDPPENATATIELNTEALSKTLKDQLDPLVKVVEDTKAELKKTTDRLETLENKPGASIIPDETFLGRINAAPPEGVQMSNGMFIQKNHDEELNGSGWEQCNFKFVDPNAQQGATINIAELTKQLAAISQGGGE